MNRRSIRTSAAPAAIGPYSQAISVSGTKMIFCSGQIPLDPGTGRLVEGDIETQTRACLDNLSAVLGAAGATLANVVKTTIFLRDMSDFQSVNRAYGAYFGGTPPARSTVAVAGLPLDARVEIEAIAVLT
ncbi:MAG: RidA family protein [Myxococcales bacterium]|nr:RidA family protein [Myxococcales bacterium]